MSTERVHACAPIFPHAFMPSCLQQLGEASGQVPLEIAADVRSYLATVPDPRHPLPLDGAAHLSAAAVLAGAASASVCGALSGASSLRRIHTHVDRLLDELDRTPAFYFDSITQLHMDTWSQGRVTLVGDAGYCPGPAVGGSTTLAVVGACVLAGELARAGGDHEHAFPAYERVVAAHVRGSRAVALSAAKTLIPTSPLGVWGPAQGARLISALPAGPSRALLRLTTKSARFYNSMTVDGFPP
ncbi:hypothetical protein [Streptomyces sp. NPDC094468]|uniref:hypothetical protein n=1 Tax=Streptomyces sp. NPDC094468 TaxID=3366066 RepID=UPI0038000A7A